MRYLGRFGLLMVCSVSLMLTFYACASPVAPEPDTIAAVPPKPMPSGPPDECFDDMPECELAPLWSDEAATSCPLPGEANYRPDFCELHNLTPSQREKVVTAISLMRRSDMRSYAEAALQRAGIFTYDVRDGNWGDAHHTPDPWDPDAEIHLWTNPNGEYPGGEFGGNELVKSICHEVAHIASGKQSDNDPCLCIMRMPA